MLSIVVGEETISGETIGVISMSVESLAGSSIVDFLVSIIE
jgi:hypothetical protein